MSVKKITTSQLLPVSLEEAWAFFSVPENLNRITPADMHFEILDGGEQNAFAGQIIRYKVRPLFNIPMSWVTEITHCEAGHYFVDEQRFGPYKFWHHLHRFRQTEGGTLAEDVLHYAMPAGPFGEILHAAFIGNRLREIFAFREEKLKEIFG